MRATSALAFGVFQAARESHGILAIGADRLQNAVASDLIVAGTLRVPSVEFVPDSVPVARR